MPNCVICGGDVSMLSQKRSMDGMICSKCMNKIPYVLHGTVSLYDSDELRRIIEYEDEMKRQEFNITSSYGKLYLDEFNGLFAICDKSDIKGALPNDADIFNCAFLNNIGIYPIDPRQSRRDIVCDVEFSCVFNYPRQKFKLKVKSGVKCDFKQVDKTHATWNEPGDLSMFRNMLDQTIKTAVKREMQKREKVLTPYEFDLFKARACLHVYEGCSIELIQKQYKNMLHMYETGSYTEEDKKSYIESLNYYYKLLVNEEGV